MLAAIEALHEAMALEESGDAEAGTVHGDALGLRQRAVSFIDMLQRNYKSGDDVVWGV